MYGLAHTSAEYSFRKSRRRRIPACERATLIDASGKYKRMIQWKTCSAFLVCEQFGPRALRTPAVISRNPPSCRTRAHEHHAMLGARAHRHRRSGATHMMGVSHLERSSPPQPLIKSIKWGATTISTQKPEWRWTGNCGSCSDASCTDSQWLISLEFLYITSTFAPKIV